ncbi:hypothetical protein NQ318_013457 [Aromia moschata]|uniref:Cytochrome P450 n=1 Tax=Aromia moschata TaxID=1265417 RepID=A0AAV8YQ76_9CUCU|nr:hypothetical protein NQ318_013457 [Aromia moschata]
MLLSDDIKIDLIGLVVAIAVVTLAYFKWSFTYWQKKGLQTLPPSIPCGNAADIFLGRKILGEFFRDIYFHFKAKGARHAGAYAVTKPVYVPIDLDIIKCILQSDFQHFQSHGTIVDEEVDPLSVNLFNMEEKMKMMFSTLLETSEGFRDLLEESCKGSAGVNIKEVAGSVIFGLSISSIKDPKAEFRKYGQKAVNLDLAGTIRVLGQLLFPHSIWRFFKISAVVPEVSDFFTKTIKETIEYREKNNIIRRDFMHMLLQLKNKGEIEKDDELGEIRGYKSGTMTLNEIVAQCFVFFSAGFETSSSTINFAAYELATNPEIQTKVREEINTVLQRYDNKLTYEAINDMNYLEKVLSETLRKYPILPALFRVCTKNYQVPGSDLIIEKGTTVMIPVLGIHFDPEYFTDPEKFDPERFSEENKAQRHSFSWLGFGEGPRICIGMRLGKMQAKVGLITLLKNYHITLNRKTQLPLVYKKTASTLMTNSPICFDLHKIVN